MDKVLDYKISQRQANVWELYAVVRSRGFFGIRGHNRDELVTVVKGSKEEALEQLEKWKQNINNINGMKQ